MVSCFKFEPFVTEDIAKTKMVASGFCNETQAVIIIKCLSSACSSYGSYRLRATKHTTEKNGVFCFTGGLFDSGTDAATQYLFFALVSSTGAKLSDNTIRFQKLLSYTYGSKTYCAPLFAPDVGLIDGALLVGEQISYGVPYVIENDTYLSICGESNRRILVKWTEPETAV